jgi:hypothetical protein
MSIFRVQETSIKPGLVTEQKEAFRVGIESAKGINIFGESKFSEGAVRGAIGRKLRENTVGLMEGEKHARRSWQ